MSQALDLEKRGPNTDEDRARCLARARNYPYDFPLISFTYRDGVVDPFDADLCEGRTPVLAFGSNQSPERLWQKYRFEANTVIPVQRALLKDFDVVYTARIASYGALPAMLQAHAGVEVSLAVTWLDTSQLLIMHESEGTGINYDFVLLEDVEVSFEEGGIVGKICAYASRHCNFVHDGSAVALSAVSATGRCWPERTTEEMLVLTRDRVKPKANINEFILNLVNDGEFRSNCTEALGRDAEAFVYPCQVIRV